MRVLLVGAGGREHALAAGITRSPRLGELHVAPGNPGISALARCHPVAADDVEGLVALARRLAVDLVVVGPEDPLVGGMVDRLAEHGIAAFGPPAAAARVEASKDHGKRLMLEAGVPTARSHTVRTLEQAAAALDELGTPVVVKADGLALGKGVTVCETRAEADAAVAACLVDRRFGSAGATVVCEQALEGPEVSLLCLCDGLVALPLPAAQDHKRIGVGDTGPNTGGMGAYSPVPAVDAALARELVEQVHEPVLRTLERRGERFQGCLYAGLMLTADGPRVLEFNVRFGDPETQALIPRLRGDLLELLLATAEGRLAGEALEVDERACVTIVLAAPGYPGPVRRGLPILGLERAERLPGVSVFHAGTGLEAGRLVTAGGRVVAVSALGEAIADARERALEAALTIQFEGRQLREDIGLRAGQGAVGVPS